MTPYHVTVAPKAQRQFKDLPLKQQRMLYKFITALAVNPRPAGTQKIEGMIGLYSETFNGIRIIYKIEEQEVLLLLFK